MRIRRRCAGLLVVTAVTMLSLTGCTGSSATNTTAATDTVTSVMEVSPSSGSAQNVGVPAAMMTAAMKKAPAGAALASATANTQTGAETFNTAVFTSADAAWDPFLVSVGGVAGFFEWATLGMTNESSPSFDSVCPGHDASGQEIKITVLMDYPYAVYCSEGYAGGGPDGTASGGAEGAVLVPLATLANFWPADMTDAAAVKAGDLAGALYLGHVYAEHVADEMHDQFGLTAFAHGDPNQELLADCFTGVWAGTAYDGLSTAAVELAFAALPGGNGPITGAPFGTPEERTQAFTLGYTSLTPGQCIQTYWPNAAG